MESSSGTETRDMKRAIVLGLFTGLSSALALLAPPAVGQRGADPKTLDFYVQPDLKDLTAKGHVVEKNDRALAKIGKGYVDAYNMGNQQVWCREPGQLRFEGKKGLIAVRRITNGMRQVQEIPFFRHKKKSDLTEEPGKGDYISDLGIVSAFWVQQLKWEWDRTESHLGKNTQVFLCRWANDGSARMTLWLDPATRTMVDRIAHHRDKLKPGFKKRIAYSEVQRINNVWVPTRAELYNGSNERAAVMKYDSIQVNSNLSDSLFAF